MSQLPDNAMSALRLMPAKASEVAQFSMQIVKAVQQGYANPLEVLVMLRSLEAVSELVREEIEEEINHEADRYSEKTFDAFGAKIEKAELGTKYSYETSKDIEWERLKTDFETAKRRLAERETFLKALKEPLTVVDESTGEVTKIMPPLKKSKSGVKIYLK